MRKYVPSYSGTLRSHGLTLPHCISECSGIRIFGKRIKSIAFSPDAAIIKNINADAIIAVYPFTPQASISQAVINVADVPVFVGVGGGYTNGSRSVRLAMQAASGRLRRGRQRADAERGHRGDQICGGYSGHRDGRVRPVGH